MMHPENMQHGSLTSTTGPGTALGPIRTFLLLQTLEFERMYFNHPKCFFYSFSFFVLDQNESSIYSTVSYWISSTYVLALLISARNLIHC